MKGARLLKRSMIAVAASLLSFGAANATVYGLSTTAGVDLPPVVSGNPVNVTLLSKTLTAGTWTIQTTANVSYVSNVTIACSIMAGSATLNTTYLVTTYPFGTIYYWGQLVNQAVLVIPTGTSQTVSLVCFQGGSIANVYVGPGAGGATMVLRK